MKIYHISDFVNTAKSLPIWVLHEKDRIRSEEPHQHDCMEIMYIEKGAGCCIMNQTCYPVLRGDIFFFHPGDVHEFIPASPLSYYNLLFSDELFFPEEMKIIETQPLLMQWRTEQGTNRGKINIPLAQAAKVEEMFSELAEECESRKPESCLLRKALFLRLIFFVLRRSVLSPSNSNNKHERQLSLLFDFIARNYAKKISIADLAKAAGVSPNYLNELLRKTIGQNITEYLLRFRLEQAKIALENPENTISWVACCSGFYDASHLIRIFKNFTGMTPGDYRRCKLKNG